MFLRKNGWNQLLRVGKIMDEYYQIARKVMKEPDTEELSEKFYVGQMRLWQWHKDRYLDQFVVESLYREAIIPTYSFPVHNVTLDIIREKGGTTDFDDKLQLGRDAALAIGEYAPDSEVVAGGRVWKSKGIIRRKFFRDDNIWVEQGKYRECQKCQHPEFRQDNEDFDDTCPSCSEKFVGETRYYTEPLGFLTSYDQRKGLDPNISRIRSKPVEEARLITRASSYDFKPTELKKVSSFFAPAIASSDEKSGIMFVVNKGPNKTGYLWCSKCEFAEPAPSKFHKAKKDRNKHRNPRNGEDCNEALLEYPRDLAHSFKTDIRILQINEHIPSYDLSLNDDENIHIRKMFLRTLSESIRLAATELLGTDPRDLRAYAESLDQFPTVILSDAVPGGAGYCRRLIDEPGFTATELLLKALSILDCPKEDDCDTSCSRCLRGYSNQQYWELLDRKIVLNWLEMIVQDSVERPAHVPSTAVLTSNLNIHYLKERLINASKITIVSSKFWGAENRYLAQTSARYIRDALEQNDAELTFVSPTDITPTCESAVDCEITKMYEPLESGGKIKFVKYSGKDIETAPRLSIIGETAGEFYGATNEISALDGLLSGVSYQWSGIPEESWVSLNKDKFTKQIAVFGPSAEKITKWEFKQGEQRDVSDLFTRFTSRRVLLQIEDPWIGAREQGRIAAGQLMTSITKKNIEVDSIEIALKTNTFNTDDHEIQLNGLKQQIADSGIAVPIKFDIRNKKKNKFHDRKIKIQTVDDGVKIEGQYDITAGIDNLMNYRKECTVYFELVS